MSRYKRTKYVESHSRSSVQERLLVLFFFGPIIVYKSKIIFTVQNNVGEDLISTTSILTLPFCNFLMATDLKHACGKDLDNEDEFKHEVNIHC